MNLITDAGAKAPAERQGKKMNAELLTVFISYSFIGACFNGYIVTVQALDGKEVDRFCSSSATTLIQTLHSKYHFTPASQYFRNPDGILEIQVFPQKFKIIRQKGE